jgi:hypothetical protein
MAAGFGAVWVRDGDDGTDPVKTTDVARPLDAAGAVDALTVAAGLAAHRPAMAIGVIADVSAGRHPAVLARDVLTLDVVSEGRAAVLLVDADLCESSAASGADREPGATGEPEPADPEGRRPGWERLGEAATVCRAMFAGVDPPHGGRYFPVGAARSHLRAVDASGPVLAVQIDCPHHGRMPDGRGPDARGPDARGGTVPPESPPDPGLVACVAAADAVVTGAPAEALASIHALVASASQAAGRTSVLPIVWRRAFATDPHSNDDAGEPSMTGEPSMIGGLIARLAEGEHLSPTSLTALGRTWRADRPSARPGAHGPS